VYLIKAITGVKAVYVNIAEYLYRNCPKAYAILVTISGQITMCMILNIQGFKVTKYRGKNLKIILPLHEQVGL